MKTITALIILVFIFGCKESITNQTELTINNELNFNYELLPNEKIITKEENDIYGVYIYAPSIFYGSKIELNSDSTFKYSYAGCLRESYSEGKWTQQKNEVILNSYQKFKDIENEELISKIDLDTVRSELDTSIFLVTSSDSIINYNRPEVYFEKWRLLIGKDELVDNSKENEIYVKE